MLDGCSPTPATQRVQPLIRCSGVYRRTYALNRELGGSERMLHKHLQLGRPAETFCRNTCWRPIGAQDLPHLAADLRRILAGKGYPHGTATSLTNDGIPSPSAHDPARNRHRDKRSWSKIAVRSILCDPRYVGREVRGKQQGATRGCLM